MNELSAKQIERLEKLAELNDKEIDNLVHVAPFGKELRTMAEDKLAMQRVAAKLRKWLGLLAAIAAGVVVGLDNLKIFLKGLID